MKPVTSLLLASLATNAALGGWWLLMPNQTRVVAEAQQATTPLPPASNPAEAASAKASVNETATPVSSPEALRDRLRTLGFSEAKIQVAVRATLEGPRLARERAFREAGAKEPWWRPV